MSGWENWELSMENETLVSDLAFKLHSQNISKTVTVWWDLLNHNASSGNDLTLENEINPSELNRTEDNVVCLMREALESGYDFKETLFAEIPCISLNKIFHAIKIDLDEIKFSSFCGFVSFWNNDLLIEQAMKAVVLPKVFTTLKLLYLKLMNTNFFFLFS